MRIYRVFGELTYETRCECPDCMGHYRSRRIDKMVEATNAEAARLHCLPMDYDGDDYVEKLMVEEPAQERIMAAYNMPTLFDLEPAP